MQTLSEDLHPIQVIIQRCWDSVEGETVISERDYFILVVSCSNFQFSSHQFPILYF